MLFPIYLCLILFIQFISSNKGLIDKFSMENIQTDISNIGNNIFNIKYLHKVECEKMTIKLLGVSINNIYNVTINSIPIEIGINHKSLSAEIFFYTYNYQKTENIEMNVYINKIPNSFNPNNIALLCHRRDLKSLRLLEEIPKYNMTITSYDDQNNQTLQNQIILKPGRFKKAYITVSLSNDKYHLPPASATIFLIDKVFKTLDKYYQIATIKNEMVELQLGVPCNTNTGSYLVKFSMVTSNSYFNPLGSLNALVVKSNDKATIYYQNIQPSVTSGTTLIGILLSEANVDELNLAWTGADTNDKSAAVGDVTIYPNTKYLINKNSFVSNEQLSPARAKFSISNPYVYTNQVFTSEDPNSCFKWQDSTLTVPIKGTAAIIPSFYDISPYFSINPDSNINTDSLTINIDIPYSPIYIYCALVCIKDNFPSYDDIINSDSQKNSPYLQYYSNYFYTNNDNRVYFNNILSGQEYKLRCIIQSSGSDVTKRTYTSGDLYNVKSGLTNTTLSTINNLNTHCLQYKFDYDIGQEAKMDLINYCQQFFSSGSYTSNGCIVCTDSYQSYTATGVTLPAGCIRSTRLLSDSDIQKTQNIQTTPTNIMTNPNAVRESDSMLYTICAVPNPSCPNENKCNIDTWYYNKIQAFKDNTKDTATIKEQANIANIPVTEVLEYDDSNLPEIGKLKLNVKETTKTNLTIEIAYDYPLLCYYMFSLSSDIPEYNSLQDCGSNLCGSIKVNQYLQTNILPIDGVSEVSAGKYVYMFLGCFNDIPFSSKRFDVTQVAVLIYGEKEISTEIITNTVNDKNINEKVLNVNVFMILIYIFIFIN
jgi:hypothetical protein